MTMHEFIEGARITMKATRVDRNPNVDADAWARGSSHWRCKFTAGERGVNFSEMTVYFSMGPALTGPPTVADVLECLASDASGADQDFESWASDCGCDADSRKAEKTYNAVVRQTEKLRAFLGERFEALQAVQS